MKKRLLITSALMTAVLGASLATGTYAWYSAASTLTPTAGAVVGGEVSVSGPAASSSSIGYSIEAKLVEDDSTEGKALILSSYNTKWYSGYKIADGSLVDHQATATETYYKVYAVQVKGTVSNDANGELSTLLAAETKNYTVTFASTLDDTNGFNETADLWTVSGTTLGTVAAPGESKSLTVAVKNVTAEFVTIGYVVVYIDGEDGNHVTGTTYKAQVTGTGAIVDPTQP